MLNEGFNNNEPMTPGLPVDSDWAGQFSGAQERGEDAPRTSDQTIPPFPYYVVRFDFGKGAVTSKANTPLARVGCVVKEGPDGTVGERVFDDIFLRVSETKMQDGVVVKKDPDEYQDAVDYLQNVLNKCARVGKFPIAYPTEFPGDTKVKAEAYAAQFAANGGFDAIVEISESPDAYRGGALRNRIKFAGMRAPDDPAHLKRSKPGSSALDEAREKIAERNKAAAARAGVGDGRTLGSIGRSTGLRG